MDQIFDHISYLKGSSVIRMLSVHLGRDTFLRGVADYLKSHAYGMYSSLLFDIDLVWLIANSDKEMLLQMTCGPR